MLRPPFEADPLALLRERLLRRGFEVLADDDELAAGVEVDDVAGDHPELDDFTHDSGLAVPIVVVVHPNLFRPDVRRRPSRSKMFETPTKPATNSFCGCS